MKTMKTMEPLKPDALAHRFDPQRLAFDTTAEVEELDDVVGQARAAEAIDFALGMARDGYNVFVMGPSGCGRHTLVRRAIAARPPRTVPACDWVYVNNFEAPHRPLAIDLPAGQGIKLRDDVRDLVEELRTGIPAVFDSDEYTSAVERIDAEYKERHESAFSALGAEALAQDIGLMRTPAGFSLAPVKAGEVMPAEEFARLPAAARERLERAMAALHEKLERIFRDSTRWRKERAERIKALNRDMTLRIAGHLVETLKGGYTGLPRVAAWLEALQRDVLENADAFRKTGEDERPMAALAPPEGPPLRRYEVNVLVDRSAQPAAPVVEADHPTLNNLVGRAEHVARFGSLVTDFTLIKAGDLHRANGGYLLADAAKLVSQPFAWEALKRALLRGEVRIESAAELYSMTSTVSLAPEPVPLEVKVVLFGDRRLYYLLQAWDPEFDKLFRVVADFEDEIDRNDDDGLLYARLVASAARRSGVLPVGRDGVARLIDIASRRASDARKLTANVRYLEEVLEEADHAARASGLARIGAREMQRAADARRHRADRLHGQLHESIVRGRILIDTDGARVGQVNGLSVFALGEFAFAEPTRITATTRLGEGQVVDIQREAQMAGAIHSKGVLILSAYLASRYSASRPFSVAASLAFEQTYGPVDGDSASLAELCALLSSLSGLPLAQSLAVTGSINQAGAVQPIGAVNEKIEGFFAICRARGLTGGQGVIIPAANVENLMLDDEVVEAAAAGRFHVYPVRHVDEAIGLLTGVDAGEPDADGDPPTVNGSVARRLREYVLRREQSLAPRRLAPVARARRSGRA